MEKREIAFRAKRIDTGQWVYGDYFKTPLTDENSGTNPEAGWFFLTGETRHCIGSNNVAFVIDPNTLGQYTGLTDKNGTKIFEGDILKFNEHATYKEIKADITFVGCGFTAHYRRDEYIEEWINLPLNQEDQETMEVIGNLHENPELVSSPSDTAEKQTVNNCME